MSASYNKQNTIVKTQINCTYDIQKQTRRKIQKEIGQNLPDRNSKIELRGINKDKRNSKVGTLKIKFYSSTGIKPSFSCLPGVEKLFGCWKLFNFWYWVNVINRIAKISQYLSVHLQRGAAWRMAMTTEIQKQRPCNVDIWKWMCWPSIIRGHYYECG